MRKSRIDAYILKFQIDDRTIPFIENNLEAIELVISKLKELKRKEKLECSKDKPIEELIKEITKTWSHPGFKLRNEEVEFQVVWGYPIFLVLVKTDKEDTKEEIEKLGIRHEKITTLKKKEGGEPASEAEVSSLIGGVEVIKRDSLYEIDSEGGIPESLIEIIYGLEFEKYFSQYNAQEALRKWNNSLDVIEEIYKLEKLVDISESVEIIDMYRRLDKAEGEFNKLKNFLERRLSYQKILKKDLLRSKDSFDEKVLGEEGIADAVLGEQENNMSINEYILIYVDKIDNKLNNIKNSLENMQKANDLTERNFQKKITLYKNVILTLILFGIFFLCYLQL